MILKAWEELPENMRTPEVRPYYEVLRHRRCQLALKRFFDFFVALVLLVVLGLPMIIIGLLIRIDSKGPVLFRQERVTTYGKRFLIHKFRTMVENAETVGTTVTVSGDSRITRIGAILRRLRLDELPQLFDVISGNMSFVGTRPEVSKYVNKYLPEYYATLLMPAGITSEASIRYKDEDRLLLEAKNADEVYVNRVLPDKMYWNLESIRRFSFARDVLTMIRTVFAVCGCEFDNGERKNTI